MRTQSNGQSAQSSCWSRAICLSQNAGQLSGGGEDDADDDVAVSSLRRRRRLSSAALGSPSSSPTDTAPSSIFSLLSVSKAGEVESGS